MDFFDSDMSSKDVLIGSPAPNTFGLTFVLPTLKSKLILNRSAPQPPPLRPRLTLLSYRDDWVCVKFIKNELISFRADPFIGKLMLYLFSDAVQSKEYFPPIASCISCFKLQLAKRGLSSMWLNSNLVKR